MDYSDNFYNFSLLILVGSASGFTSGLLGIGGGFVIVPALLFALPIFGVTGPDIPKIAMATSLALIVPTSIASAQAHAARGAIDWRMLLTLTPCVIIGAFITSLLVPAFNAAIMAFIFATFAIFAAWKLVRPRKAAPESNPEKMKSASLSMMGVKAVIGGGFSAAMGIGGAFFAVPMLASRLGMTRAIGTASALALPIAIAGAAGYMMAETPSGCREGCMGYIFFPAVAAAGISAVLTAPLGAAVSHRMPVIALRVIFALFLLSAAANLVYKTISPPAIAAEPPRAIMVFYEFGSSTKLNQIALQVTSADQYFITGSICFASTTHFSTCPTLGS